MNRNRKTKTMMMVQSQWVVIAIFASVMILNAKQALGSTVHTGALDCSSGLRQFDPLRHKQLYKVGVHATGSIEEALGSYNLTFEQYLTATAGKSGDGCNLANYGVVVHSPHPCGCCMKLPGRRFQPPIEFKMEVTTAPIFDWVDRRKETDVDFFFADTGVFSCIGVEMGAEALATLVSHTQVRGLTYDLDVIGGMLKLAKN